MFKRIFLRTPKHKTARVKRIAEEDVLRESVTQTPGYAGKHYLIYVDTTQPEYKIRVNTYFTRTDGKIELLNSYDCGLCFDLTEYQKLSDNDIEKQAYNCWMTGAH